MERGKLCHNVQKVKIKVECLKFNGSFATQKKSDKNLLGNSGNVWENLGVVGRMLEISRSFLGVSLVRKKSQKNLIGNNH